MKGVFARRIHDSIGNFFICFLLRLRTEWHQAYSALSLLLSSLESVKRVLDADCGSAAIVKDRRQHEPGQHPLGPKILLNPQQEHLEGDQQQAADAKWVVGGKFKDIPGETFEINLRNGPITISRNLTGRNFL